MKFWKRAFCLSLAATLMLGTLAGCNKASEGETGDTQETGSGDTTAVDDGTVTDLPLKLIGVPADTVLFTVNGDDITAEDYVYWLGYGISYYENYLSYYYGTEIDWTQENEGQSLSEYFRNDAYSTSVFYNIVAAKAAELNLTLTEEDEAAVTEQQTSTIEQLGGQEEYERNLRRAGISEETLLEISRASYYYNYLSDALYGEGSDGYPTDEEMDQYIEDNGWMYVKHILLSIEAAEDGATDEEKATIDAANAAQLQLAQSIVAQLNASDDPATLFDTLMNQYSEDTGLSSYPNGYTFQEGQMDSDFEAAATALAVGEISDVVTTTFGYHIIERLDADTADLRTQYADDMLDDQLDQWVADAEIVFVNQEAYDAIDPQTFYTDLKAYWDAVDAAAEAEDSGSTDTTDSTGTTDAAEATDSTAASNTETETSTTTGEG